MANLATSDYLENKIINHTLRSSTFSPCPVFLSLYISPTTASGLETYTDIKEVSASTGYKRISASLIELAQVYTSAGTGVDTYYEWQPIYAIGADEFWEINNGIAINKNQINFPTATSLWGNITHIAIVTGSTGTSGSLYFWGTVTGSPPVTTNDVFSIGEGGLSLSLQGDYTYYLADNILNYILRKKEFPSPGLNVYAALYNILPDDTSPTIDGRNGREVSGSVGYVRKLVSGRYIGTTGVGTGTGWTPPSAGSTVNTGSLVFAVRTWAQWGEIEGIGLVHANTEEPGLPNRDGVLYKNTFTNPIFIDSQDGLTIPALGLKVSLT